MEKKRTKKEIVQMLLSNQVIESEDEEQLLELLFDEPIAIDVDRITAENETFGDRIADKITALAGSWGCILCFIFLIVVWIVLNLYFVDEVDPYPFILLNLVLSCVAALQAPVIMMSQNRSAKKDTLRGKNDYKTDLKSELILEQLHIQMEKLTANQNKILRWIKSQEENDSK